MIKELIMIIGCLTVADAVVCKLSTCLSFQCGETTCPPGQRVKIGGGFCGCCNNCVIALNEGETCNPDSKYGGYPAHKGVTNSDPMCDYGLKCDVDTNKCIKSNQNATTKSHNTTTKSHDTTTKSHDTTTKSHNTTTTSTPAE